MALLFLDSFDHYDTPGSSLQQFLGKWTAGGGGIVAGRTGQGLQITGGNVPFKTLVGAPFSVACAGEAYQTQAFSNPIFQFSDANNGVVPAFGVQHVGDGRLQAFFGAQLGTPSTFVMALNQFYFVECKVTCNAGSPSSISFIIRVNGLTIITQTVNGVNSFTPTIADFVAGAPGGGNSAIIDDLYVTDGEFLGDIRVICLYRRLDGDRLQWEPISGTDHTAMVKEHPPDDDTTYLYDLGSPSMGDIDEGYLDNLPGSPTIKGVQGVWRLKNAGPGSSIVKGTYKDAGGTTFAGPEYPPSQENYLYLLDPRRKSVFTGNDWTASEINSLQEGIYRTS